MEYEDRFLKAINIRAFETTLLNLYDKGKLNGTVHTCIGQELSPVLLNSYLVDDDFIVSNHRGHGHFIARNSGKEKGLMAEIMGKKIGCSGGYGGSQHTVEDNFLTNGIQGGMTPIAAGIAFYNKTNNNGIVVAYIGDGTLGQGVLYESINCAAAYGLPLLFILEDNKIAQSTPTKSFINGNLRNRFEGFGLKYYESDSADVNSLDNCLREAVNTCRSEKKPSIVRIHSYRLKPHSKGDDNRPEEVISELSEKDVLNILFKDQRKFGDFFKERIEHFSSLAKDLEKEETLKFSEQVKPINFSIGSNDTKKYLLDENSPNISYNNLIYESLKLQFEKNKETIIIGEDISNSLELGYKSYGGAFKVTKDMSDLFPGRVLNTPISEQLIVGFISGYSIKAGRSIAEIMFGDFLTLCLDQIIQHASKFEFMYNGKVKCPILIRTPMGGKRGYGPTHSQSIEKHFLGIPNFGVIALNHRIDPNYILEEIYQNKSTPMLLIENKILYTLKVNEPKLKGYDYSFDSMKYPNLFITPIDDAISAIVFCYGEMLSTVEKVARELLFEEEIFIKIVCPSLISEINFNTVEMENVHIVVIEEGNGYASWGSQISDYLSTNNVTTKSYYHFKNDNIIPSSKEAEINTIPGIKDLKEYILQI